MEQTAVEWLTFHWMELDKKYYGGEIGRIDYRNRRDAIQVEAKEMEKQKIIDFAIWFNYTNTEYLSYEQIIEQYYNETFK